MLFEISYINKRGDIESSKPTICGEEFESVIHVMKFRSKKTFIYDATVTQNETYQKESFLTQSSIHSIGSNNLFFQSFNKSMFGRHANINVPLNNSIYNTNEYSNEEDRYSSI